jgi:hypothetical protein
MSLLGKKWPAPVGEFSSPLHAEYCVNGGKTVANGSCRITGKTMFPFFAAGMLPFCSLRLRFAHRILYSIGATWDYC